MSKLRPPAQHTHLDQVDDGLHNGPLRPVLVVGGVEQRVEGVVEASVDGPIHQTVHTRIREQIEASAQQIGHLDNINTLLLPLPADSHEEFDENYERKCVCR